MGANAAAQRYCNWAASSACSNRALQQPTQVKSQAQRPINKREQWKEPGRLTTAANGCHTTVTRLMAATPQALWLPQHCTPAEQTMHCRSAVHKHCARLCLRKKRLNPTPLKTKSQACTSNHHLTTGRQAASTHLSSAG